MSRKNKNSKTRPVSLRESAVADVNLEEFKDLQISQAVSLKESDINVEKREITLTLFQEGSGNMLDKRYYSSDCVESAHKVVMSRRKMFCDHPERGTPTGQEKLREWCGTIKESWTVREGAVNVRKGRIKVHEDWFWTRCIEAPEEIACSIEGTGAGRSGEIGGKNYTIIEKLTFLNAVKFVTYPGNAKMGADLVESQKSPEDSTMDWTKLTLEELKENCPKIFKAIAESAVVEASAEAKKLLEKADTDAKAAAGDLTALEEKMKADSEGRHAESFKVIEALKKRVDESERKSDALEARTKIDGKKVLAERLLKESKLPEEAKTPRLSERLMKITEKTVKAEKDGDADKVVTVEAQMLEEIAEVHKLVTHEYAAVVDNGGNKGGVADPAPEASSKDFAESAITMENLYDEKRDLCEAEITAATREVGFGEKGALKNWREKKSAELKEAKTGKEGSGE